MDYHKRTEVSRSDLLAFRESPAHFYHYRTQEPPEPTAAMKFGEAYHMAILEPARFAEEVSALTDNDKVENKAWTSAKNQEAKREKQEQFPILVSEAEYNQLDAMRSALQSKPAFEYIERATATEEEYFGEHAGIGLRAKMDAVIRGEVTIILDLKTCMKGNANPDKIAKSMFWDLHYYQAGLYSDLVPGEVEFGFIFQEKAPPYEATLAWVAPEFLAEGVRDYRRDVELLAECYRTNSWPGYEYLSEKFDGSVKIGPRGALL